MGKPFTNFNWHIEGGGKLSPSPYANLAASLYAHAVFEMRSLAAGTYAFDDAANFLLSDPYGVLSKEAKEALDFEIWAKREKRRAALETDLRGYVK